jgi:hypothetical protein
MRGMSTDRGHRVSFDLQARDTALTPPARRAVARAAREFSDQFPTIRAELSVYVYGPRGDGRRAGCSCLARARIGRRGTVVVASAWGPDDIGAVQLALAELARSTRAVLAGRAGVTAAETAWSD